MRARHSDLTDPTNRSVNAFKFGLRACRDMYKPLPVNETPRSFYTVIRAFALLNDITIPKAPDLAVNEMFGLRLDGPGWSQLVGRRALVGTLSNRQA